MKTEGQYTPTKTSAHKHELDTMHNKDIESREDLADYIDKMADDFRDNINDWENITVEDFLRAAAAWLRAMHNYYRNTGQEMPHDVNWSLFADILSAAKHYE